MLKVGILYDPTVANDFENIFLPEDIQAFRNEAHFIVPSGIGTHFNRSDYEYDAVGGYVTQSLQEVITLADVCIVSVPLPADFSALVKSKKIFISNHDFQNDEAALGNFLNENISLFAFNSNVVQFTCEGALDCFKSLAKGFLHYYIGEPVDTESIGLFSNGLLIKEGKINRNKLKYCDLNEKTKPH